MTSAIYHFTGDDRTAVCGKGRDTLDQGEYFIEKSDPRVNCNKCRWAFGMPSVDIDMVNRPPHYTSTDIEVIDIIEAFELDFHLGNVVKYVLRHKKKNGIEDLKKARWYLDREIERRSK